MLMRFDLSILCAAAVFMVPLAIAIIGKSSVKAMAANPEAKSVFAISIVAMAFCESIALFCFGFLMLIKG